MTKIRRPRVAAIGLNDSQVDAIRPLCGDLRTAASLGDYLQTHSWSETDVAVATAFDHNRIDAGVHLLTIGPMSFGRDVLSLNAAPPQYRELAHMHTRNTEREMTVAANCPDAYMTLAAELNRILSSAPTAPPVITARGGRKGDSIALVETTSRRPVALLLRVPRASRRVPIPEDNDIALILPAVRNLGEWFRAFLTDVHESDPVRVPQAPPRLSKPSDWYAPEENALAERIAGIEGEIEQLDDERQRLETDLAAASDRADRGIRRAIWEDGDELVAVVCEILQDLDFIVENMDAGLKPNERKREDLRLTIAGLSGWEAIAEIKGYTNGTRTSDNRQIGEYRVRYSAEKGNPPDLTLWIWNPFRRTDPSSRQSPDSNVAQAAETVEAVFIQTTDLYRQWALVQAGSLNADDVVQDLIGSNPGLWTPTLPGGRA